MSTALKEKTSFRKIGNSLGIIVPANIRELGDFSSGDEVYLECPRPGVITISSIIDGKKDKVKSWNELQAFIATHKINDSEWPKDKSFKDILNEARDERCGL